MVVITFPDRETEEKALGFGSFSRKNVQNGRTPRFGRCPGCARRTTYSFPNQGNFQCPWHARRLEYTRITVQDVYYYLKAGRSPCEIKEILSLNEKQFQAAVKHIQENAAEVETIFRKVEERVARGNPAEIEAQRRQSGAKVAAWLKERRAPPENAGEGDLGGH